MGRRSNVVKHGRLVKTLKQQKRIAQLALSGTLPVQGAGVRRIGTVGGWGKKV